MARTRQTARRSTGGKAPRYQLQHKASRITEPRSQHCTYVSRAKYKVAYITKRSADSYLYHVIWWKKHGTMPRTWEPRHVLEEDGFGEHLDAVDSWTDQEAGKGEDEAPEDFFAYLKRVKPLLLTASDTKRCGFEALRTAVRIIGHPEFVTEDLINCFITDNLANGKDLTDGTKFPVLCAFVRLKVPGLWYKEFKKNRQSGGYRRIDAILRLNLENGVYVIGASTFGRIGHCFTLQVIEGLHQVIDEEQTTSLMEYGEWIENVLFVSKVVIKNE